MFEISLHLQVRSFTQNGWLNSAVVNHAHVFLSNSSTFSTFLG